MDKENKAIDVNEKEEFDMAETGYAGYVMPSTTPWITKKRLKRTPPSEDSITRAKYIDSHDFSIDLVDGKVIVKVTDKK